MRQAFIQRRRDLASHHGTQVARKAGAHLSLQLLADHLLQVGAHGLVVHHLRNGLGNDLRDRQMRQRGGIVCLRTVGTVARGRMGLRRRDDIGGR